MIFRTLAVLVLLCVTVIGGAVFLLIDSKPQIPSQSPARLDDAETVTALMAQVKESISSRYQPHTVEVSKEQVESLVGFLQRAVPTLNADALVTEHHTLIAASMPLPAPLDDFYFNIESRLLPAEELAIDYIKVGDLRLPGDLALNSVVWLVDNWTHSEVATNAKAQISKVDMSNDGVVLTIEPLDALLNELNTLSTGLSMDQDDELRQQTAYYLQFLASTLPAKRLQSQSLSDYVQLVMTEAAGRSQRDTAVAHNEAALMALAIFIGHHRMANLVGDVQPDANHALKPAAPAVLHRRHDLAQHFTISAALEVVSRENVTMAIGEFKELMDRAMGGSGYSFVDLAADMSGIAFARLLLDPAKAYDAQRQLAGGVTESNIIPSINGLPEGMSKAEFDTRFGEVDSPAYQAQVSEVKRRVDALPLYQ